MQGQWVGVLNDDTGARIGDVVLDLDDFGTYVDGHFFVFHDDRTIPSLHAAIKTTKALSQTVTVDIWGVTPMTPQQQRHSNAGEHHVPLSCSTDASGAGRCGARRNHGRDVDHHTSK